MRANKKKNYKSLDDTYDEDTTLFLFFPADFNIT